MNSFGNFLYTLRKEKGITQAELAEMLGITNKAVSKWETGEAMPETAQLLPISRIFGVSVDELLAGERNTEKPQPDEEEKFDVSQHLFTRGKDDFGKKTLCEKICGLLCGFIMISGVIIYVCIGIFANLWHPHWVIIPVCALACGVLGIIGDLSNKEKCERKKRRGENPFTGAACGIIMLSCTAAYLLSASLTGLWHPLWIIMFCGGLVCFVVGAADDFMKHGKKKD